jgi:hypothetical protein
MFDFPNETELVSKLKMGQVGLENRDNLGIKSNMLSA